jgi:hypothetical protein
MIAHLALSLALFAAQDPVVARPVATPPSPPLLVPLGKDLPPLMIPRDEELVYRARVTAVGVVEATVGTVTLSAGVEPYNPGLILPRFEDAALPTETGWLKARARGGTILYTMDAEIATRFLPQEWPRVVYRYEQRGTENRKRELLIGARDGAPAASYRSNTSKGAPKGTRIWRPFQTRDLPAAHSLDTMGAVYLARSMIQGDHEELDVLMLTKLDLWQVKLRRGERKPTETELGRFDTLEVVLESTRWPGDEADPNDRFEGLFGIHGSMHIWVQADTGIPVRVVGDVPLGPIDLGCDIRLISYRGTPPEFRTLPEGS